MQTQPRKRGPTCSFSNSNNTNMNSSSTSNSSATRDPAWPHASLDCQTRPFSCGEPLPFELISLTACMLLPLLLSPIEGIRKQKMLL